ncbi:hypothetical protein YC2023_055450 [Brassica napus]
MKLRTTFISHHLLLTCFNGHDPFPDSSLDYFYRPIIRQILLNLNLHEHQRFMGEALTHLKKKYIIIIESDELVSQGCLRMNPFQNCFAGSMPRGGTLLWSLGRQLAYKILIKYGTIEDTDGTGIGDIGKKQQVTHEQKVQGQENQTCNENEHESKLHVDGVGIVGLRLTEEDEGRAEFLNHGAAIAVVCMKILRISQTASDRAVRVGRFCATPALLHEMLQLGGVSKLCLVLQVNCGSKTKEKAKELLKLHARVLLVASDSETSQVVSGVASSQSTPPSFTRQQIGEGFGYLPHEPCNTTKSRLVHNVTQHLKPPPKQGKKARYCHPDTCTKWA